MISGTQTERINPDYSTKCNFLKATTTNGTPRPRKQWKPERSLTYWKMETIKSTTMLIHCRFDVAYSEIVFVKTLKSFKTLKFTKDESRN